jgi:hypothetical protein
MQRVSSDMHFDSGAPRQFTFRAAVNPSLDRMHAFDGGPGMDTQGLRGAGSEAQCCGKNVSRFRHHFGLAAIVFVVTCWPGLATAAAQSFAMPGHGALLLNVPEGWKSSLKQPSAGLPPTIGLSAQSGASFLVLLTAVWGMSPGVTAPDDAKIKSTVASAAKSAEPQSAQGSLALQNLAGASGRGYYFRATDRAPKPGEWKYLTQGMIRTGGIALTFTILTNDGQAPVEKAALEMIRLAVQQSGEAV